MGASPSENAPPCTFTGNPDLYGLGVRLYLYMQLVTAAVLKISGSPRTTDFREASLVLGSAIAIVFFHLSVTLDAHAVEFQLMALLIYPQFTIFSTPAAQLKFRPSTIMNLILTTAMECYWVWFYFRGVDLLPTPSCGTSYAWFIYVRVDLLGWFRKFCQAFSVMGLVGIVYHWFQLLALQDDLDDLDDRSLGRGISQLIGVLVLSIPATELIIKWNGISGVNSIASASQLIPFLLGIGQVVQAALGIFETGGERRRSSKRISKPDNRTASQVDEEAAIPLQTLQNTHAQSPESLSDEHAVVAAEASAISGDVDGDSDLGTHRLISSSRDHLVASGDAVPHSNTGVISNGQDWRETSDDEHAESTGSSGLDWIVPLITSRTDASTQATTEDRVEKVAAEALLEDDVSSSIGVSSSITHGRLSRRQNLPSGSGDSSAAQESFARPKKIFSWGRSTLEPGTYARVHAEEDINHSKRSKTE